MRGVLLFLIICIYINISAGEIILCKDVKPSIPKTSLVEWSLEANKKICMYYTHDAIYTSNTFYKIAISKRVNGFYQKISYKDFPVQKGKRNSIVYFDITEPGNYIVSIIDNKGYIIGEQNYTVV